MLGAMGAMCSTELSTCVISCQHIFNKYIGVWQCMQSSVETKQKREMVLVLEGPPGLHYNLVTFKKLRPDLSLNQRMHTRGSLPKSWIGSQGLVASFPDHQPTF